MRFLSQRPSFHQPTPLFQSFHLPKAHLQDVESISNSFVLDKHLKDILRSTDHVSGFTRNLGSCVLPTLPGSHCPLMANPHTHHDQTISSFPRCHLRASLCSAVSSSWYLPVPVGRAQVRSQPNLLSFFHHLLTPKAKHQVLELGPIICGAGWGWVDCINCPLFKNEDTEISGGLEAHPRSHRHDDLKEIRASEMLIFVFLNA